jgi:hypothetical protein
MKSTIARKIAMKMYPRINSARMMNNPLETANNIDVKKNHIQISISPYYNAPEGQTFSEA